MKKLHGLVISWFYPPGNSSEGLVTYKLLRNSDYTYDVFTRRAHDADMFDRPTDETRLIADNVRIVQATMNENDAWVAEAVEFFEQNREKYDFVMTRCMTAAAHDAGLKIKQKYPSVKWLASFGDPLVNSPYIRDVSKSENPHLLRNKPLSIKNAVRTILSPTRRASRTLWEWQRKNDMQLTDYFRKVNRTTFELADLLIFNNECQRKHAFQGEYTRYINKGVIVNHSFDSELYPKKVVKSDDNKLHFVYVGHLDAFRNAGLLFEAIKRLKNDDPKLREKVRFDFYGHMDDGDKAKIIDFDITDVVFVHHDVDYLTSLTKISEADWAVLIDTNLDDKLEEYIFCPAKLMDYLGSQKEVFAITQTRGATADVIRTTGCGVLAPHKADEVYCILSQIIDGSIAKSKRNEKAIRQYDAKVVANKFDGIVKRLLDK